MRQNHAELDIDYFFTDTGKELPEVYEFLVKLRRISGKADRTTESRSRFRLLVEAIQ